LDIRVEKITEIPSSIEPRCLKGNGMPGATSSNVVTVELKLLEALANVNNTTTMSDLLPEIQAYQAVLICFLKLKLNHKNGED